MRSLRPPVRVTPDTMMFYPAPHASDLAGLMSIRWSEVSVGLHRLVLTERIFGLPCRRRIHPWGDLVGVSIFGNHHLVLQAEDREIHTFVIGDPGHLAWIAGEIRERLRRTRIPAAEQTALLGDRRRLLTLSQLARRSDVA